VREVTAWLERCATAGVIQRGIDCESAALAFLGALQVRAVLEIVVGRPQDTPTTRPTSRRSSTSSPG
jgi:hypothetical protein